MLKLWLICAFSLLTSCGGTDAGPPISVVSTASSPPSSAIAGTITAGPTCPVERIGHPCAPMPVSARVEAHDAADRVRAATTSASDGHFRLRVPPGQYTVVVVTRLLPRCPPTAAHVPADAHVDVTVVCDTGIR